MDMVDDGEDGERNEKEAVVGGQARDKERWA
jgi:hypothetical protein